MAKKTQNLEFGTKEVAEQQKKEEKTRKKERVKSKFKFTNIVTFTSIAMTEAFSVFTAISLIVSIFAVVARLYYAKNWIDIAAIAAGAGLILVLANVNDRIRH